MISSLDWDSEPTIADRAWLFLAMLICFAFIRAELAMDDDPSAESRL